MFPPAFASWIAVSATWFAWCSKAPALSSNSASRPGTSVQQIFDTQILIRCESCVISCDFDSFLSRLKTKLNILREVSLENKTLNNFQSTWAHLL